MTINPIIFPLLPIEVQSEININISYKIDNKIIFKYLVEFVKEKYPMVLNKDRHQDVIQYKMPLIYVLNKYLKGIALPNGKLCNKKYISNNLFGIHHATFIYSSNTMQGYFDSYYSNGNFHKEVRLCQRIELEFIRYFKLTAKVKKENITE